jgi:hypothetical protein
MCGVEMTGALWSFYPDFLFSIFIFYKTESVTSASPYDVDKQGQTADSDSKNRCKRAKSKKEGQLCS